MQFTLVNRNTCKSQQYFAKISETPHYPAMNTGMLGYATVVRIAVMMADIRTKSAATICRNPNNRRNNSPTFGLQVSFWGAGKAREWENSRKHIELATAAPIKGSDKRCCKQRKWEKPSAPQGETPSRLQLLARTFWTYSFNQRQRFQ